MSPPCICIVPLVPSLPLSLPPLPPFLLSSPASRGHRQVSLQECKHEWATVYQNENQMTAVKKRLIINFVQHYHKYKYNHKVKWVFVHTQKKKIKITTGIFRKQSAGFEPGKEEGIRWSHPQPLFQGESQPGFGWSSCSRCYAEGMWKLSCRWRMQYTKAQSPDLALQK